MRIVVTGIGVLCAIGKNKHEVIGNIEREMTGIRRISLFDHSPFDCKFAGEIHNYEPKEHFTEKEINHFNRCVQFSIIAIKEALQQANLDPEECNSRDIGLCFGTSHGPLEELYESYKIILRKIKGKIVSGDRFKKEYFGLLKSIASYFDINGSIALPSIACASGTNAIGMAIDLLKNRKARFVICGGSDAIDLATFSGFWGLRAVSPSPTSPFSTGSYGITIGEGAAFFVLESLESATSRNAETIGEIFGYALTNDAHHASAPHPQGEGAKRCMEQALKNSGFNKYDIDYINAHGTGTESNDIAEKNAILSLYDGNEGEVPPISSTKAMTGHALGAAGAIELAISLLCMPNCMLPPTVNFKAPRFKEKLDYIPNRVRKQKIKKFLSNSFAFAGCNAAIIAGECEETKNNVTLPAPGKRVVITGIGGVCSLGVGKQDIWNAFENKKYLIKKIDLFDMTATSSTHASLVTDFRPRRYARGIDLRRMDRISQFATVSASLCLKDAKFKVNSKNMDDIGIVYAVAPGPMTGLDKHFKDLILKGPNHPSQVYFPYSTQNSSLGHLTVNLNVGGYTTNLVEGGASLGAVGCAFDAVKLGHQERILSGGSDELSWYYHHSNELSGELTTDDKIGQNRLFSPMAEGYIPGEGAAFLMLEDYNSAYERNAPIYGEIVGFGMSIDSNKDMPFNDPKGENLCQAMRTAIEEAGIPKEQIGIVLSSDRGMPKIAKAELHALRMFFGDHLQKLSYTTTRFNTGWLNSSTAAFNIISLLYTFTQGAVLPIAQDVQILETEEFNVCKEKNAAYELEYGMVLNVSREGVNAAMILRK